MIVVYDLVIGTFWTKKSVKSIKIFELYQVFMYNFLSQNDPIPPNHILTMRTKRIFNTSQ